MSDKNIDKQAAFGQAAFYLTSTILSKLIARGVFTPEQAHEMIDHTLLIFERHEIESPYPEMNAVAREMLEALLNAFPKAKG